MTASLPALLASHKLGVLAVLAPDGRPHLSNINYAWFPDEGPQGTLRVSLTDTRVKVRHLRRDPRVTLHVRSEDGWHWVAAEGDADLTPVAAAPDDATVEELIDLYRRINGEHPDWDDYRAAMVRDRRLVLRIRVTRLYGQP